MQNIQDPGERKINAITKNDNVFDLVKIKVRLDEHFYIFSRFIIIRMLTLSRVKKLDAIQIAKDIKKQLIDRNQLEINAHDLEAIIFETMMKFGYQNNIQKYQMVSNFYRNRTPMIIIIFGAPCIGKSILANNLAERLNISNVLQTDIVEMVMRSINPDQFSEHEDFSSKYKKNCYLIRRGVQTDITKCLQDGKAVIIEGSAAMPEHYLEPTNYSSEEDIAQGNLIQSFMSNEIKLKKTQRKDLLLFNQQKLLSTQFKILFPNPCYDESDQEQIQKQLKVRKELDQIDQHHSMILGFLPIISRNDHLYNIENNMSKKIPKELIDEKLNQFQIMQSELLKQRNKCIVLPINLHNLEETLDTMHDIILQKILDISV